MGAFERSKGGRGEREFFSLCRRKLPMLQLARNLSQTRDGGADGDRLVGGFAVEVKRQERWQASFWSQAVQQADALCAAPALAYRANHGRWVVMIRASELSAVTASGSLLLCLDDWIALVDRRLRASRASQAAFERI